MAKRVQILHVYPGFLPNTNGRPSLFDQGKPECMVSKRSFLTLLLDIANSLRDQRTFASRHPKYRMMQSLRKDEDIVQILSDVLSNLPNVTDYYVTWYGLPAIAACPAPFVASPLKSSLRKLSLDLSLENVQSLVSSDTQIPSLEELHLCIHTENVLNQQEQRYILERQLAPAIRQFRKTLKTLVLSSWEPTDLSPLFNSIDRIPGLTDLSVNIPVEPCHLGDPSGLLGFLKKQHDTIRTLRLRATQYGGTGLTPNLSSVHEWIRDSTDGVELPKLQTLDITSSLFPIQASLLCLQRFSRTLTSLSMTGVYSSYIDVAHALDVLCNSSDEREGLEKLRIGPISLSPQLVDLFATRIPKLHRLELLVRDIVPLATSASPTATAYTCEPKSRQIVRNPSLYVAFIRNENSLDSAGRIRSGDEFQTLQWVELTASDNVDGHLART